MQGQIDQLCRAQPEPHGETTAQFARATANLVDVDGQDQRTIAGRVCAVYQPLVWLPSPL